MQGSDRLTATDDRTLRSAEGDGLGVSLISCWEVAKLVELGRLELPLAIDEWLVAGLRYPGVRLIELTTDIVVDATRLPGTFHRDPADQLLVATARRHNVNLVTADSKILAYPHVSTLKAGT